MTAAPPRAAAPAAAPAFPSGGGLRRALDHGWVMTVRNLQHDVRAPAEVLLSLCIPLMMVLVFGYVFGEGMAHPGTGGSEGFRAFLMPGIFVMAMLYSVSATATGVAQDADKAVIGRFRSMPMASSALLTGRAAADMLRALLETGVLIGCGLLIGWNWQGTGGEALQAIGLVLLFRFAMTWVGIYLGLAVRNPSLVGLVVYPLAFPLGVLSTTFTPPRLMPAPVAAVAEWNPVSSVVNAARELFGNPGVGGESWVAQHPLLMSVVWPLAILAVCVPPAVARFRRLNR
ncbi:ABC transporter permease [Streptomonospora arabica]|uniref:Transport permease protein n=1 Tax=Streptomonospora arabica TaxID=412417 RepID=A0ABV9SMM8_9ACTN